MVMRTIEIKKIGFRVPKVDKCLSEKKLKNYLETSLR